MERTIILWLVFTIPACFILAHKKRGAGYYILAILLPLIGFIVALCLKNLNKDQTQSQATDLDITKEKDQQ